MFKLPRRHCLSQAPALQAGFGLMETLLVLGAASLIALGVYAVFFSSDVTAEVKGEQANLNTLSTNIERSLGLTGGFSGLSLASAAQDRLLPEAYGRSGSSQTVWGSAVDVRPNTVAQANDSFVIDYASVPAEACSGLASAMASNVYDLRVGGTSVMSEGGLNPASATAACQNGARMEFVYYSGLTTGTAVATPSLTLPTAPPSVNPANPTTPSSPVTGAPDVADVGAPAPVAVTPGSPTAPPPAVPTAPPAPADPMVPQPNLGSTTSPPPSPLTPCSPPGNQVGSQQVACPAGQYGLTNQQRVGTYSCPEAWDAPVLTWGAWTNASSSCAACPSGTTESRTQWVASSQACPAGQSGSHTWEREQRSSRSVGYNCPAGTTSLPAPSYGGWGAWSDTGARRNETNTCQANTCNSYWSYEVTEAASGGCGSQGGGSGGTVETPHTPSCSAANAGESWQSGYAERWNAQQPDCDITTYTCSYVNDCGAKSTGDYSVMGQPSCWQETHRDMPSLREQARSMCEGVDKGTTLGAIHYFEGYQIGCYAEVVCE